MRTFTDASSRQWAITIDGPAILRVRAGTCDVSGCKHLIGCGCKGVDLGDLEEKWKLQLRRDVVLLVNTLYLLCQPEAHQRGISDEQFGACLVGDALQRATIAMDEAIADFFPEEKRKILRALAAKDAEVCRLGMERALAKLNDPQLAENFVAAMEAQVDEELRNMLTRSSSATSSPALSASTPREEPCGSSS
jgi:hypothetical protein